MPRSRCALPGTLLLTAAALVLSGCADGAASPPDTSVTTSDATPSPTAAVGAANQADVEFAQMMIVHHQGAIEMARLAPERAEAAEVKELAQRIEVAQQPEIETMTGWLAAWGAGPLASDGAMPGMDHGAMGDTGKGGVADEAQMAQFEAASGADFDTLFLQLMTVHHEGAVAMAQAEVDGGENADAVALAHRVIVDQTAEITLMATLLEVG